MLKFLKMSEIKFMYSLSIDCTPLFHILGTSGGEYKSAGITPPVRTP